MKQTTAVKTVMAILVGTWVLNAVAVEPAISDVSVRQRWPWSRLVDIDYVLNCDPTQSVDVALTAYNGSTALTFPQNALSGDLYNVSQGGKHVVLDPLKTAYTNDLLTQFRVSLTPTNPPVYMIVDLTKSAGASNQIEYIYPGDGRLVTDGRWTNVWFGVTNDSIYATDKLVLRRIRANTFSMGDATPPIISCTLTKDFYAGVFEVTEAQWQRIMTGTGGTSLLGKGLVSYNDIRGATNDVPSINWYATGSAVGSTNFLGVIRTKTGIGSFDLPTEAQWEYICRATTTSYYNDGESTSSSDTNVLNRLAWNVNNSGGHVHAVGGKEANAWGLYDTLGNEWELCLNWYDSLAGGTDPAGPVSSGSSRTRRGGSWGDDTFYCRLGARIPDAPSFGHSSIGFRLVRTLP